MHLLSSLILILVLATPGLSSSDTESQHSIQKRQTTVTFTSKYEDIRELIVNIVVAFTFATLAVFFVAPLFGYKLDLLVSTFEEEPLEAPLSSAYAYTEPAGSAYPEPAAGYAVATGRRLLQPSEAWYTKVIRSIDLVDTGLNWMEIEGESCRQRAICEAEYAASQNTIARLAINTINSNLRGLDKYSEAVDAGLNGADCALLYSECPPSTYQGIFSIF